LQQKKHFIGRQRAKFGEMARVFVALVPAFAGTEAGVDFSNAVVAVSSAMAHSLKETTTGTYEGDMFMGGSRLHASCSCKEDTQAIPTKSLGPMAAAAQCFVEKVKVRQDHRGSGMALAEVSALFGDGALTPAHEVSLVKVQDVPLSCLDDRMQEGVVATPGGDLGEFILAIDSYNDMLPVAGGTAVRAITQEMVDSYLQRYLKSLPSNRKFQACTDDSAVQHIQQQLQIEGLNIADPAASIRDDVFKLLSEPENVGDLHLKLLLRNPDWYHLDPHLTGHAIRAFYRVLWDQSSPLRGKLDLKVLTGDHNPAAFVEVSTSQKCDKAGMAPKLIPRSKGKSLFLSHLDAASMRRTELANFFATKVGAMLPEKVNADQLQHRLDRHGWQALEVTGSRVAKGLPFYSLAYV